MHQRAVRTLILSTIACLVMLVLSIGSGQATSYALPQTPIRKLTLILRPTATPTRRFIVVTRVLFQTATPTTPPKATQTQPSQPTKTLSPSKTNTPLPTPMPSATRRPVIVRTATPACTGSDFAVLSRSDPATAASHIVRIDMTTKAGSVLDAGMSGVSDYPRPSDNGTAIVFSNRNEGDILNRTKDLYLALSDGSIRRLTKTTDKDEAQPVFAGTMDAGKIVYTVEGDSRLESLDLAAGTVADLGTSGTDLDISPYSPTIPGGYWILFKSPSGKFGIVSILGANAGLFILPTLAGEKPHWDPTMKGIYYSVPKVGLMKATFSPNGDPLIQLVDPNLTDIAVHPSNNLGSGPAIVMSSEQPGFVQTLAPLGAMQPLTTDQNGSMWASPALWSCNRAPIDPSPLNGYLAKLGPGAQ